MFDDTPCIYLLNRTGEKIHVSFINVAAVREICITVSQLTRLCRVDRIVKT